MTGQSKRDAASGTPAANAMAQVRTTSAAAMPSTAVTPATAPAVPAASAGQPPIAGSPATRRSPASRHRAARARSSGPWSVALLIVALLLWQGAVTVFDWSQLVLPSPGVVAASLYRGFASGYFWPHIWQTTVEVVLGLALGGAVGFACGLALGESAFVRRVVMPYVVASQVMPKLALAPLLTVWLGFGTLPMVVITALVCFFPLLESTLTGIAQADPARLELFRMLGASRWKTLWRLKVPTGLPGILAGLRMAVVLALVGAVVGEFIGGSVGLGALIIAAQGSMDTPLMFAVLALITVQGLLLYHGVVVLQQLLLRRYVGPLHSGH